LTIDNVNITKAIEDAEEFLKNSPGLSADVKVMMNMLLLVVRLLLNKAGLNSRNSSTPPSKDPNRDKSKKDKGTRKPGGQEGHEGTTLTKVANPDVIKELLVDQSKLPPGKYKSRGYDTRQVVDIVISKVVTEYRAEIVVDEHGNKFRAPFPNEVTRPIQYGASVKTHAAYFLMAQLIPYERTSEYLRNQFGLSVSQGTLANILKEAHALLEPFEVLVKKILISQDLLHADETGINIGGKTYWLHSASNEKWTLFHPHAQRGYKGIIAGGVLDKFKGILCTDHWKAYFKLTCLHSLCNAHHLRELERAFEQDSQSWAKEMKDLLCKMNNARTDANGMIPQKDLDALLQSYRDILKKGDIECPAAEKTGKKGRLSQSKSRNLLVRLKEFEEETLRFLKNPTVPFTNNQGERDIRMTKVQQKISGCFRSLEGAIIFCRIRSYLSTCNKHGMSSTEALQILFSGKMPDFLVIPDVGAE
jgi:transposase